MHAIMTCYYSGNKGKQTKSERFLTYVGEIIFAPIKIFIINQLQKDTPVVYD